jgi:hypothetical protein
VVDRGAHDQANGVEAGAPHQQELIHGEVAGEERPPASLPAQLAQAFHGMRGQVALGPGAGSRRLRIVTRTKERHTFILLARHQRPAIN